MLSIYAFKVISMDDFVEKQQDVQLKSMRKSFGISTIILISSSILYACFIYPDLIASEATISSVLSFMSSLSMVGCLSATLVLISVFISSKLEAW